MITFRFTRALSALLGLFALGMSGCGGAGETNNFSFTLEGHHYEYTHAYYNVLGATPVTSYTLELSDLDCATEDRGVGDDLDVQLFPSADAPPYTVKIEAPDPAKQDTYLEGSGTVTMKETPPQFPAGQDYATTAAAVAALDATFTGTIDYTITGGGQTLNVTGSYSATHCPRMDNP